MVGRMGGGLHFLVEIELKMAEMPAFTNLNMLVQEFSEFLDLNRSEERASF